MVKGSALIIDDEKNIRLTLSRCLKYMGLESDEAINGEEGLRMAQEKKYDVILVDMKMQGMDGLEVLKRIKDKDNDVPVIIITAHGTVDIAVDAMKLGASDFMQKPFTPEEIQKSISEILARKNIVEEETPKNYDSCIRLARVQISKKMYDSAIEYLKKAISMEPTEAEPHNLLGAIMEIKGNLEDAKKYYKAALALQPGYLHAQTSLIRVNNLLNS